MKEREKKKDEEREIEEREAAYHLVRSAFAFLPSVFNSRLLRSSFSLLLLLSLRNLLPRIIPPLKSFSDRRSIYLVISSPFLFFIAPLVYAAHTVSSLSHAKEEMKRRGGKITKQKGKHAPKRRPICGRISFERGFTRIRISVNVATFLARRFSQEPYSFISVRSFNPSIVFDLRHKSN